MTDTTHTVISPKGEFYPDARILVVDDELLFLAFLKKILKEDGYRAVTLVQDPIAALKQLKVEHFDLLLLDQNMSGMSGFQLLESLNQLPAEKQIPVMMLTAAEDQASRRRALALGALDFLTKPFDVIEVTSRIRNVLQLRMLHNALEETNQSLEKMVKERTRQLQREVDERKRIEERLEYLGATDPQTGLPSEMIFMDRLRQLMCYNRSAHVGTAVVGVRVLTVKDVDERDWLRELAQRLDEQFPEGSVMRNDRVGFLILHTVENQEQLELVIRKVDALQGDDVFGFYVSYEIDWTCEVEAEQIVQQVRSNLQEGKRDPRQPTSMKALLHQAIFEHQCAQFELVWQPQIELSSQQMTGVEVLLRWNSPELGFVSPAKLVEVAEQEGWIGRITRWVIQTAVSQYRQWMDQGLDLDHFSVNLSAQDLVDGACVDWIKEALLEHQVPSEKLCVELTESELMANVGRGRTMLQELRELGIKVALDDFGTGYSSLSYLKMFPINLLKIDRSFSVNLLEDDASLAIINAMTQLAQFLKIAVVVEGVEYEEQVGLLRSCGVDLIQGYYYSRPLPPNSFLEYVHSG